MCIITSVSDHIIYLVLWDSLILVQAVLEFIVLPMLVSNLLQPSCLPSTGLYVYLLMYSLIHSFIVCMSVWTCMPCVKIGTTCRSLVSPSTMWVLGIKFRSLCLMASTLSPESSQSYFFYFIVFKLTFICLCVYFHGDQSTNWRDQFFLPSEFWGPNSSWLAWWQAPLSIESSQQPSLFIFYYLLTMYLEVSLCSSG